MNRVRVLVIVCATVFFGSAFCGESTISPEEYERRKEVWIQMHVGKTDNMTPEEIEAKRKEGEANFVATWGDAEGAFKALDFGRIGYQVNNRYLTDPDGGLIGMVQDDGSVKDDGKIIGHVTDYVPDWKP